MPYFSRVERTEYAIPWALRSCMIRILLFRLAGRNRSPPFEGAQSLSYRGVSRDEPHALTESFAFSWGLAGVPVSGMNRGAVAAQTNLARRLRLMAPAFRIPRDSLLVLWLGIAHRTPSACWLLESPVCKQKFSLTPSRFAFQRLSPFTEPCFNSRSFKRRSSRARIQGDSVYPKEECLNGKIQSDGSKETVGRCCGARVSARGLVT